MPVADPRVCVNSFVLQSSALRVELDPGRGGALCSLRSSSGDEWIFFDESRGPQELAGGEAYDDVWRGGFEELFPSDAPGLFDGLDLPDHGELWNSPLELVSRSEAHAELMRECRTIPAVFSKRVSLDPSRPTCRIDYRITNVSSRALRFLFKLHPAIAVRPGDRILLPGGRVTAVDPAFGTMFGWGEGSWPEVPSRQGGVADLSVVPSRHSKTREFVYVHGMPAGWCGIERAATGERVRFTYPLDIFPFCWLFMTFGGWRDYNTVVLEPCTNMPKDLEEAAATGRCAQLERGTSLTCSVLVTVETHGP